MRHRAFNQGLMLATLLLSMIVFFVSDVLSFGTKSESTGPTVTVPNGGESWKVGSTYTIKWKKGTTTDAVKIEILKNSKRYATVIKKTANTGAYKWKIPKSIAKGSEYKIKITNSAGSDFSNKKFTVTGGKSGGSGGSGSFKVTSPNGGESLTTGKSVAIKWGKGTGGSFVKILLLKSGKASLWIHKKTKNDGKYTWKIPASLKTGNTYKIKISSTTKKSVSDTSDGNFAIKAVKAAKVVGPLTVTSPNGGEKLTAGTTKVIKWKKGNGGKKVKIQLLKSGRAYKAIISSTLNDGKHPWKIPASIGAGSNYKIKITSITKKTISDSSNSSFKIVAKKKKKKQVKKKDEVKEKECTSFNVEGWCGYIYDAAPRNRVWVSSGSLCTQQKQWIHTSCSQSQLYQTKANYYYPYGNYWATWYTGLRAGWGSKFCEGDSITFVSSSDGNKTCKITGVDR